MLIRAGVPIAVMVLLVTMPLADAGAASPDQQQKEAARFKNLNWAVVRSVDAIDPSVLKALRSHFGKDDRLANAGAPFNATDIVDGRPTRRLVIAGHSGKEWFVVYERGGYALYIVLVVFDTNVQPLQPVLLANGEAGTHDFFRGWRVNLSDIWEALKDGKLSIGNPNNFYY